MAARARDPDLNAEEEEEARTAIDIVPVSNRFEFTPIPCPVLDNIKKEFPDTTALMEEWWVHVCAVQMTCIELEEKWAYYL